MTDFSTIMDSYQKLFQIPAVHESTFNVETESDNNQLSLAVDFTLQLHPEHQILP